MPLSFVYSKNYTVAVSTGAYKDSANNAISVSTNIGSFTTGADTTPPTISTVTPNGSGVSQSGNIVITFSEVMNTAAVGTVSLGGSTNLTSGSWSNGNATYTIPYSGLSYSTAYAVAISGFKDVAGNTMFADSAHSVTILSGCGSWAPSIEQHTINTISSTGGSISSNGSDSVEDGNTKTYTITANEGYKSKDVLVDGVSVGSVSTYTFMNVKMAHTIEAVFEKTTSMSIPFVDVKTEDWFYEDTMYVYHKGLMNGTAENMFSPNEEMTRAMIVTVLYRLSGDKGGNINAFSDVKSGSCYKNAANWAYAKGITSGVGGDSFAPQNALTREHLTTMLFAYANYSGLQTTVDNSKNIDGFADAGSISAWASDAMKWAVSSGIIDGNNLSLYPQVPATRSEIAAMLRRIIENVKNQ